MCVCIHTVYTCKLILTSNSLQSANGCARQIISDACASSSLSRSIHLFFVNMDLRFNSKASSSGSLPPLGIGGMSGVGLGAGVGPSPFALRLALALGLALALDSGPSIGRASMKVPPEPVLCCREWSQKTTTVNIETYQRIPPGSDWEVMAHQVGYPYGTGVDHPSTAASPQCLQEPAGHGVQSDQQIGPCQQINDFLTNVTHVRSVKPQSITWINHRCQDTVATLHPLDWTRSVSFAMHKLPKGSVVLGRVGSLTALSHSSCAWASVQLYHFLPFFLNLHRQSKGIPY